MLGTWTLRRSDHPLCLCDCLENYILPVFYLNMRHTKPSCLIPVIRSTPKYLPKDTPQTTDSTETCFLHPSPKVRLLVTVPVHSDVFRSLSRQQDLISLTPSFTGLCSVLSTSRESVFPRDTEWTSEIRFSSVALESCPLTVPV